MRTHSFLAIVATLVFAAQASADLPVFYDFNGTGTTVINSGTLGNSQMNNSSNVATDLHSADGGGVSAAIGDRAFDNTASSMGGTGGTVKTTYNIPDFQQFTISSWFNTNNLGGDQSFPNLLRYHTAGNNRLTLQGAGDTLATSDMQLTIDGNHHVSPEAYAPGDEWIFLAVTYDGLAGVNTDRIKWYKGSLTDEVSLIGANDAAVYTIDVGNQTFAVGNSDSNDRAFDALIDNFRLHTGEVLDTSALESLRAVDAGIAAVPEPAAIAIWGLIGMVCCAATPFVRRRMRGKQCG